MNFSIKNTSWKGLYRFYDCFCITWYTLRLLKKRSANKKIPRYFIGYIIYHIGFLSWISLRQFYKFWFINKFLSFDFLNFIYFLGTFFWVRSLFILKLLINIMLNILQFEQILLVFHRHIHYLCINDIELIQIST